MKPHDDLSGEKGGERGASAASALLILLLPLHACAQSQEKPLPDCVTITLRAGEERQIVPSRYPTGPR